jgi:Ca2+-binding RTX toxin-like protein
LQTKHPIRAVTAVLAACALLPATASASTLTIEGGTIVLRAAPGELNQVSVQPDDAEALVEIGDADAPDYSGSACEPSKWDLDAIACPPQPNGVRIEIGDRDDRVDVHPGVPGAGPLTVIAGDGDDDVSGAFHPTPMQLDGGPGNDTLAGGLAGDALIGGPGDDDLGGRAGADELRGGDGNDKLLGDDRDAPGADTIDGGPGSDRIENDWTTPYPQPQPPVAVSLDGQANDGRPGEGDNVTGVEWIHLSYPATLVAGGDAVDFEVFNTSAGPTALTGGPGADRLRSYDAADTIAGLGGDDWIEAGYGNDTVSGGPGRDTINADAGSGACNFLVCRLPFGNDVVDARDGEADSVECGPGDDVATVDRVDTVSNCETVDVAQGGPGGGGGTPRGGCVVPKVKRGAKLPAAKAKLRRAGCATKVVRIRSAVKRGRVVKLAPRAGKRPKAGAKVKVYVSRGKARRRARGSAIAHAADIRVVSPPPKVVTPVKVRCVKPIGRARICGKRFDDSWERGWWSEPAVFEIVDARFYGDTELTVPFDEYKSFRGEGYSTIKAKAGFKGRIKLPRRGARVPASVGVAKPIAWRMESIGAWTTTDGSYDCSVRDQPAYPPTSVAGVFAANQRKGTINVQWSLAPAGFRCGDEGPMNPDFDALPSEAMSVQYKASAFRDAELLKLPIRIEWEGVRDSDGTRLKLDWSGQVVLRRVHHRL